MSRPLEIALKTILYLMAFFFFVLPGLAQLAAGISGKPVVQEFAKSVSLLAKAMAYAGAGLMLLLLPFVIVFGVFVWRVRVHSLLPNPASFPTEERE